MKDDSSPDETKDLAIDEGETDEQSDDTQVTKPKTSRFANLENMDFNFEAYEEKIVIVGASGSGKTYLANTLMKSLNGISVWVYDPNYQFHSSRAIVFHDLDELLKVYDSAKRGHYILQPHDGTEHTFRRLMQRLSSEEI